MQWLPPLLLLLPWFAACDKREQPPRAAEAPAIGSSDEGEAAKFVDTVTHVLVGHRAPAVTLELLDGTRVDLAQLLGRRPIYLKFWATWCVPCREQMPHLVATQRAHGDKLAVFAIDVGINDPIENVREFVATKQLPMPVAYDRDGSIAEKFHLNITPQHVLIDAAGIVRHVGHAVTPQLERTIAALVDPPREATTPGDATPAPSPILAALALDDGSKLDLTAPSGAPIALTFATLFCDSYIADSRPAIGAACAAHARQLEQVHKSHPDLRWITIAFPVWTDAEDIGSYRKRLGATVPIGIDRGNAWFRHFGVRDTYTTLLLDSTGKELGRVGGDGSGLAALIEKAR